MKKEFMDELEDVMTPKPEKMEVRAEDAPVKMKFKKKLTRKKKENQSDDAARAALKGPQSEEMK